MSDRVPDWYAKVPSRVPAAPPPRGPGRGSCPAVNADTGLPCRLPAHVKGDHHDGRTRFVRLAAPGQTSFPRVEQLLVHAQARQDAWSERGPSGAAAGTRRRRGRPPKTTEEGPDNA